MRVQFRPSRRCLAMHVNVLALPHVEPAQENSLNSRRAAIVIDPVFSEGRTLFDIKFSQTRVFIPTQQLSHDILAQRQVQSHLCMSHIQNPSESQTNCAYFSKLCPCPSLLFLFIFFLLFLCGLFVISDNSLILITNEFVQVQA